MAYTKEDALFDIEHVYPLGTHTGNQMLLDVIEELGGLEKALTDEAIIRLGLKERESQQ